MKNMQDLHSEKIEGGVDYSYFEFLGYATVVDLAAIKKLVFEEKRLTMREVLDAMNANFVGYEPIQEMLKNAPCYGNNDPYADSIAKDVDRFTQVEAEKSSRDRGIHVDVRYVPITTGAFGKIIAATLERSRCRVPLADGSSASHGADHNGPTAVLLSNYHSKNYGMINRASRLLNIVVAQVRGGRAGREENHEHHPHVVRPAVASPVQHRQPRHPARRPEGPEQLSQPDRPCYRVQRILLRHVPRPAERHHRPHRTRGSVIEGEGDTFFRKYLLPSNLPFLFKDFRMGL